MKKNLLALLLACCMVLGMIPAGVTTRNSGAFTNCENLSCGDHWHGGNQRMQRPDRN